jgi:uncharacterized membrane protein
MCRWGKYCNYTHISKPQVGQHTVLLLFVCVGGESIATVHTHAIHKWDGERKYQTMKKKMHETTVGGEG